MSHKSSPESNALKVMIVDDDATTLEITAAVLEERGYRVVQRKSALGTSASILKEQPDIVLLDVHMPGLKGDRIARAIVPRVEAPPVIILYSGSAGAELRELARESGADGFIEKGGDMREFLTHFERLIRPALLARGKAPPSSRKG